MSHNPERYKSAEPINTSEALMKIRDYIGELPDLRQPNQAEVEEAVEALFPSLLVHERSNLVDVFLQSEQAAADEADSK